jgi:hypothetical protein
MQHRAVRLMASKLAVAGIIEGNFTDEGLAAMSDCADMTTALARELTQGIKNEVEDLSAVFKKMAVFKAEPNPIQIEPEHTGLLFPKEVQEELFSDFSATEVSPVAASYDLFEEEPLKKEPPEKESIEEDIVLQRIRLLKDTIKSSGMPDSGLLEMVESMLKEVSAVKKADSGSTTRFPADFDPFAEQAA